MFYIAHGAYRGSGSSCRNLERVVLVSESTVYQLDRDWLRKSGDQGVLSWRVHSGHSTTHQTQPKPITLSDCVCDNLITVRGKLGQETMWLARRDAFSQPAANMQIQLKLTKLHKPALAYY